jgi:regulator of protease activity HflC (stomatin/prohibitin superfamily)
MTSARPTIQVLLLAAAALIAVGCDNVQTPQGEVTYLYKEGRWYRSASLEGTQRGPTSTGWRWQMSAISFDHRPKTYEEHFEILVKDDINVSFQANAIIAINSDEDAVKEVIEGWGVKFYDNIVQEALRAITREVVSGYNSREIRASRQEISTKIKELVEAKLNEYEEILKELNPNIYKSVPIVIQRVNVDNLDYPKKLQAVISKTRELEKQLEQKSTELEIAAKDKERRVQEAQSIARRMKIIGDSLGDEYITHYAIEVAKRIAASDCPTIVVIPMDPAAPGVPYVGPGTDTPPKPKKP